MTYKSKRHVILYIAGFLDLFAVSLVVPAFPVHVKSFGTSSTLTGVVTSIYGAIQLFSSPLVGKWSDRSGRLKVMSVCIILSGIGYFVSGFFITSLLALSLLRIFLGIFKHTQDLCRCCLIEESGFEKNQAIGAFNAISSVGFIVGPTIHGHLVYHFGSEYGLFLCYATCGFIFVLNFALLSYLRLSPRLNVEQVRKESSSGEENGILHQNNNSKSSSNTKEISQSLKNFQRGVFVSRFFLALAVMMFRSSFVLWLTYYYPELPSTTIGYILSYNGFLGLFFGFLVGSISNLKFYHSSEEKLQLHASHLVLITFFILLISTHMVVILLAMAILTLGTAVLRVCGIVLTAKYLEGDDIGQTQGLGSSVISVARFAAPLASGILQDMSFSAPNVVCLMLSAAGIAVFYYDSYSYIHRKGKNI